MRLLKSMQKLEDKEVSEIAAMAGLEGNEDVECPVDLMKLYNEDKSSRLAALVSLACALFIY